METQEITFLLEGQRFKADVQMLCEDALIFIVHQPGTESFHLECDEDGWQIIEKGYARSLAEAVGEQLIQAFSLTLKRALAMEEDFFILENGSEEIICCWNHDLRLRITESADGLRFGDHEEQIYVGSHGNALKAFQTIDFKEEHAELVDKAIAWYTGRTSITVGDASRLSKSALSLN